MSDGDSQALARDPLVNLDPGNVAPGEFVRGVRSLNDVAPTPSEWDRENAWYQARRDVWCYNKDHYYGGRVLHKNPDYLPQFAAESNAAYRARAFRSTGLYNKLVKRALGVYQSQVFRDKPDRELPDRIKLIEDDVDRYRTPALKFFQRLFLWTQLTGQQYVLVDAPRVAEGTSEAAAQSSGLRPYFESVPVENLIDWDVERDDPAKAGALNYVVIRDCRSRSLPFRQPYEVTRYRVWTPTEWSVWERRNGAKEAPSVVKAGTHKLGRVPLVVCYDEQEDVMKGVTTLDDVAMSANSLWNSASAEDESYFWHCFNQLVIKTESETLAGMDIGGSRAIKLRVGEDASYLAPSAVPFEAYEKRATAIIEHVTDLVFNRTSRQQPTGQVESAEKRKTDREEFVALLENKANEIQRVEVECFVLAAQWAGMTEEQARAQIKVEYSQEFDVDEMTVDDWEKSCQSLVRSRTDWVRSINPELSEAEALAELKKNQALEESLRPIANTEFGMGGAAGKPPTMPKSGQQADAQDPSKGDNAPKQKPPTGAQQ